MQAGAEDQERKIPPLERVREQLSAEILDTKKKVKEVQKEMEDMEALVGDSISDDEGDFAGKKTPPSTTASTKETRQEDEENEGADEPKEESEEDED